MVGSGRVARSREPQALGTSREIQQIIKSLIIVLWVFVMSLHECVFLFKNGSMEQRDLNQLHKFRMYHLEGGIWISFWPPILTSLGPWNKTWLYIVR